MAVGMAMIDGADAAPPGLLAGMDGPRGTPGIRAEAASSVEAAPSDAELASLSVAGDRDAFGMLIDRHYDLLHRLALRICGRRADAEDVAQDVCVRLPRALRTWSGAGRIETWLYTLVLNAVRDAHRRDAGEQRRRKAWANEPRETHTHEGDGRDDAAEAMWRAVARLPDKQRNAVALVYGEGLGHAEAARAMGCAEATVSYHVHAARKRLRTLMLEEAT